MEITKDEIIAFLRKHKQFLEERFGVTRIALFGSYARGEQTTTSDIDLLVEMIEKDFKKRFYLKEFLERAFGRSVDVGYFESVRPLIKQAIEKDLFYA